MDCRRIDEILNEHATGTLNAAARTEFDEHIAGCRRCADAWLSHDLLAADRLDAPRPELYRQLSAKVFDRTPTRAYPPGPRFATRLGIAASAIALAGVAGLLLYGGSSDESVIDGASLTGSDLAQQQTDSNRFALAAPAAAIGEFVAGRDYESVRDPSPLLANGARIQICEFFMFECVYCYNFEASLAAWEATLPDAVSLERVPALFNPRARLHAQAYYAAEKLGVTAGLSMQFYEAIHVNGNRLDTLAAIREFFARRGIADAAFDAAFGSPEVAARLRRAEELNALYGVTATPSLGVNGRYLTNPGLAGSNERMLEVVDAIVADEAEGRCGASGRSSCPLE
jgi:thiol:disulfide interchange protein DsbA